MDGDRRHQEIQGLLAAYSLGAITQSDAAAVEEHVARCPACHDELAAHEAASAGLTGALDRMWARVSGTLAGRREDLDCFLTEVLAGNDDRGPAAPVRVLVAADTDAARSVLAGRLAGDERFSIVGQAATPAEVLSEGIATMPDVVVVKLTATQRSWLEAVSDLVAWSPRTRLVAVSGINARHLADLLTTSAVVESLEAGQPPAAVVMAHADSGSSATRAPAAPDAAHEPAVAPRSIIHEVMRQVGLPVREQR